MSLERRVVKAGLWLGACAVLCAGAASAIEPKQAGGPLEAREFVAPELVLSSANVALEDVLDQLPNRAVWGAWLRARGAGGSTVRAFVDARSGASTSILLAHPLIPGRGAGNRVTLADLSARLGRRVDAVDDRAVAEAAWRFVDDHKTLLGVQADQLGGVHAAQVNDELWQISIPQQVGGVRVRDARLV